MSLSDNPYSAFCNCVIIHIYIYTYFLTSTPASLVGTIMADSLPHSEGDNQTPAASTSSRDAKTKPGALSISPQKALHRLNAADAVGREFDKGKIIARMESMTDEVFNMDEETRKKAFPLPSQLPHARPFVNLGYIK